MPPRKRKPTQSSSQNNSQSQSKRPSGDRYWCECAFYCNGGKAVSRRSMLRHEGIDEKVEKAETEDHKQCRFCSAFPQGHSVSLATWYRHKEAFDFIEEQGTAIANELTLRHRRLSGEADILANMDQNNDDNSSPFFDDIDEDEQDVRTHTARSKQAAKQAAEEARKAQEEEAKVQEECQKAAERTQLMDEELDLIEQYTYFDTAFGDYAPLNSEDDDQEASVDASNDVMDPEMLATAVKVYLRLVAFTTKEKTSRQGIYDFWKLLEECFDITLPSIRYAEQALQKLTGIIPKWIDVCGNNNCMAFTGDYEDLDICRVCKAENSRYHPRRHGDTKPLKSRKKFMFIPLLPRLRAQYRWPERAKILRTYRHNTHSDPPGIRADVFHGDLYRNYHRRERGLFENPTDIALQMSLDGFVLTTRGGHSCTPVILVNLNLPPSQRYQMHNVILSMIIPGPNKPKDLDSFLQPLIQEMNELHEGIPGVLDASTNTDFTIKAWIILCTGDGPAVAEVMGMKNPGNAKSPCRCCYVEAERANFQYEEPLLDKNKEKQYDANGKLKTRTKMGTHHYIPHRRTQGIHPEYSKQDGLVYAGGTYRVSLREMCLESEGADNEGLQDYGITRVSILHKLESQSLHYPRSFPIDAMHCVLLNVCKVIHQLWSGTRLAIDGENPPKSYKNTKPEMPSYVIPKIIHRHIGNEIEASRPQFPSHLGHAPRSPFDHFGGYTAAEVKMHLLYFGPAMYHRHQKEIYMENFRCLAEIFSLCERHSITDSELKKLEGLCVQFVKTFQKCYWRGEPDRLAVMGINVHSIIHLAAYVKDLGPGRYWWQFVMESYCGFIKAGARSKSQMDVSLSNWCMRREHLNNIPFVRKLEQEKKEEKETGLHKLKKEKFAPQHVPQMLTEYIPNTTREEFKEIDCYLRYRKNHDFILGSEHSQRPLDITRCNKNICFREAPNTPLQYAEVWYYADLKEHGKGAIVRKFTDVDVDKDTRTVLYKGKNQPLGARIWIALDKIESIVGIVKQTWVDGDEATGHTTNVTDYYLLTDANQFD